MAVKMNEFLSAKIEKSGASLKGISGLVTQAFEIEAMTKNSEEELSRALSRMGKGTASEKSINDGNGWNDDTHWDCSLHNTRGFYGTETSSSPIDISNWGELKKYLDDVLTIYKTASGGSIKHTVYGSMHVHNTISYTDALNENGRYEKVCSIKIDSHMVYHNVARFFLKFMPVMKWLVMTDKSGARGTRGSSFGDKFDSDNLYYWWNNYHGDINQESTYSLMNFDRSSCFRVMAKEKGNMHYENRLCDCTFNATHIGMWLAINRAITLMAIDFTRNGFIFNLNNDDVTLSRELMRKHSNGYRNVSRETIEKMYKEFVGYLAKYLKICGSLEAIDVMDKLIACPIPQYLNENDVVRDLWNMDLIEKVFNTRNRASDTELRDRFLHGIKTMSIEHADSLNEFLENTAKYLEVEVKKVKSLYQMFKREHIEIEFLVNRLVYLGD